MSSCLPIYFLLFLYLISHRKWLLAANFQLRDVLPIQRRDRRHIGETGRATHLIPCGNSVVGRDDIVTHDRKFGASRRQCQREQPLVGSIRSIGTVLGERP